MELLHKVCLSIAFEEKKEKEKKPFKWAKIDSHIPSVTALPLV